MIFLSFLNFLQTESLHLIRSISVCKIRNIFFKMFTKNRSRIVEFLFNFFFNSPNLFSNLTTFLQFFFFFFFFSCITSIFLKYFKFFTFILKVQYDCENFVFSFGILESD